MQTALRVIENIITGGIDIFTFVLFFLSMKKCFWKEGRSKGGLFFLTLFTYPTLWFFISMALSLCIVTISFMLFGKDVDSFSLNGYFYASVSAVGTILFIFAITLCIIITIIWLKFKNIAAFLFLYTMYLAIFVSTIRGIGGDGTLFSIPYLASILDIIASSIGYFMAWTFYRRVVLKFSELLKENPKISWKLFIIPPLLFSLIYCGLAFLMMTDFNNDAVILFSTVSSIFIVLIFIWAFYVIIKNMMATNEAIKAKEEIKTLSVEVMEALAHTIDAKDEYTKGHSVRVAKYSKMLAERLGLNDEDCESVYYMALLHDIGKIGVPNEIINSKSKMTDEEYAIMKTHPGIGSDILEEIKSRPDLMIGARWHHERYDGKGYPDQKAGEDIPYFARIISVADSYDAMTSNRSYRKFLPQDVVRGEIEKNCGTQFDPNVAKCMLSIIDEDVNYEYHE